MMKSLFKIKFRIVYSRRINKDYSNWQAEDAVVHFKVKRKITKTISNNFFHDDEVYERNSRVKWINNSTTKVI